MQRARHHGFVMEVYPEGLGWKYYIHNFEHPELDCFGTLESEDDAKKKALKSANTQDAKLDRYLSSDPVVWVEEAWRKGKSTSAEAVTVAGNG